MKSVWVALCLGLLVANPAHGKRTAPTLPDCLSEASGAGGVYEVTLNLTGLTKKQVFGFLSALAVDPIWPESITTNKNHLNRKHDLITATVKPNMNRFEAGTSLEATRSEVEPALANLMRRKGVIIACPAIGD